MTMDEFLALDTAQYLDLFIYASLRELPISSHLITVYAISTSWKKLRFGMVIFFSYRKQYERDYFDFLNLASWVLRLQISYDWEQVSELTLLSPKLRMAATSKQSIS